MTIKEEVVNGSHLLTQLNKGKLMSLLILLIKLRNMVFVLEVVGMGVLLRKLRTWKGP